MSTSTSRGFIFGNTASPTPAMNCLRWDEINVTMEGREVCVYGTVTDYDENWEYQMTNIYFGDREKFFLVSNFRWDSSLEGQCILVNGEIQLNTYKTPYIKIDEIYRCE
jgi:hypothetical protein